MAYVTPSSGQVLVPSAQYVSPGTYYTPPVNSYPPEYRIIQSKPAPAPGKYAATFSYTSAIWLGVLLVCATAVAFTGFAFALRYYATLSETGAGLWCGAMFVSAGAVAIAAGHHRTDCLVCATTATSAFAVMFGIALVTISAIGLSEDVDYFNCYRWCPNYPQYYSCPCYYENWASFAILGNSLMVGAGSVAIIFGFWLFIVCCMALCRTPGPQVVPVQYIPVAPQSMGTTSTPYQQQVLSIPVPYVQQSSPLNHPPGSTSVFQGPDHHHSQQSGVHHGDDIGLA